MPNSGYHVRAPLVPDARFSQIAIPVTRMEARLWYRVHRTDVPAMAWGKRPYHRFSHPDSPMDWLYLGSAVAVCLWEYFGDDLFREQRAIAASRWKSCSLSGIHLPELPVCATNQLRTRESMGVDRASLMASDLSIPQAWGLALQRHPAGFAGIEYSSRFLDRPCLALFDREGLSNRIQVENLGDLPSVDSAVDWLDERGDGLV